MQNIFRLTNKNITLMTPLILFSLFTTIYMSIVVQGKILGVIFGVVLLGLMTAMFIAGWFYSTKLIIENSESTSEPLSLLKSFPEGVGTYFLSSVGSVVILLCFFIGMIYLSYLVGIHSIGNVDIDLQALKNSMATPETLKTYFLSLNMEQIIQLTKWQFLILGFVSIAYYLIMFYFPVLFYKTKNPIKAFFVAVKDMFGRKFFKTLGVYLLIWMLNIFVTLLTTVLAINVITNVLGTLLNFYFTTLVVVGVFYYYYNDFVLSHIGQNVDITL